MLSYGVFQLVFMC